MSSSSSSSASSSSPSDSMSVFESAFSAFHSSLKGLELETKSTQNRLEVEFAILDDHVKKSANIQKEYKNLVNMYNDLKKEKGDDPALDDINIKLGLAKQSLEKIREMAPSSDSVFLRFMLGKVNAKLWKNADKISMKNEYNKFKNRSTLLFILWPLLQLFFPALPDFFFKLHQLWLMYYYNTLSLRENILQANGSNIQSWWIIHHYISIVISVVMLLYPSDWLKIDRKNEFLWFGLLQGVIMLIQNRYQQRRSYVRKTLGKATQVDVDTSETLVEKPTDLKILIPLLYALYLYEVLFGVRCFWQWFSQPNETQPGAVLTIGFGFLLLGVGNAYTTALVLTSKNRLRQLKRLVQDRLKGSSSNKSKSN